MHHIQKRFSLHYVEYEFKNIILMCFDGKNNYLKKVEEKVQSNSNNKKMSQELKIDFH